MLCSDGKESSYLDNVDKDMNEEITINNIGRLITASLSFEIEIKTFFFPTTADNLNFASSDILS